MVNCFNTQPRGGGCVISYYDIVDKAGVSTHSRAEAAAQKEEQKMENLTVSTHSRAEAAASFFINTHKKRNSFNTQPRGGGCTVGHFWLIKLLAFQHTAARRRLRVKKVPFPQVNAVSTHSRAEAAAT